LNELRQERNFIVIGTGAEVNRLSEVFILEFSVMRFRFCGDADAPDWFLAETFVLSKLSSVRMLLLCRQVLANLLGRTLDVTTLVSKQMMKRVGGRVIRFPNS
jgi:hypothetical protein